MGFSRYDDPDLYAEAINEHEYRVHELQLDWCTVMDPDDIEACDECAGCRRARRFYA